MQRLLVLACSKRKDAAEGLLPALYRYDGPAFRVLRKFLREHESGIPFTLILSAKYGLIPADRKIPNYDCRLTRASARALRPQVLGTIKETLRAGAWNSVGISAGKDYQAALEGVTELIPEGVPLELIGGGLGQRLKALRDWLTRGNCVDPGQIPILRGKPCSSSQA